MTLAPNLTFYLKRGDIHRVSRESGLFDANLRKLLGGKGGSKTKPTRGVICAIKLLGEATVENLKTTPLHELTKYEVGLLEPWLTVANVQAAIAEQLAHVQQKKQADDKLVDQLVKSSPFLTGFLQRWRSGEPFEVTVTPLVNSDGTRSCYLSHRRSPSAQV